jgi:DNA-binding response OmpR family regulator
MSQILIVEDDRAIAQGLRDNLEFEGHQVHVATDGESALRAARDPRPDLIVLDIRLPGMSGYEVCRKLRAGGCMTPILMLTARGEEEDRVLGLDLGADDYVTKPFSVRELLARVRALLRRANPPHDLPQELRIGDITADFRSYEAHRGDRRIDLTRKEFGLLQMLASREGRVVTRDELLETVWGYDAPQSTRTVDNHVATLRAKLEADPSTPRYLHTVHGVGYKLVRDRPDQ